MISADNSVDQVIELSGAESPDRASQQHLVDKVNEALFYINMVKNSTSVSLSGHQVLTNIFSGQLIYLDERDVSVSPHLMFRGIWEEHSTQVLRRLLSPGDTFFDIGANFGYFSLLAGLEIDRQSGGTIHLFEANPDLASYLEKSLSVNGLTPYSTLNSVAVADIEGTLTLNRIKHQWGGATMHDLETLSGYRPVKDEFDAEFVVPAITIDSYVADNNIERVDFAKIDVEGFEDRVYRGMGNTIADNPELKIFLEFTGGAYGDPEGFFEQMAADYAHIYFAPEGRNGELIEIKKMAEIAEHTSLEIAMLLLTNSPIS